MAGRPERLGASARSGNRHSFAHGLRDLALRSDGRLLTRSCPSFDILKLKSSGVIDGAGFNVLAPPPLDDGFAAYYDQVQAEIEKKGPKHAADTCKRFNDLRPKPPAKDDTKRPRKMRRSASSRSTWTWSHRSTRSCSRKSSSSSRRKELERGMSRRQDAPAFDSCDCSSSSPLALPPKPLVRG